MCCVRLRADSRRLPRATNIPLRSPQINSRWRAPARCTSSAGSARGRSWSWRWPNRGGARRRQITPTKPPFRRRPERRKRMVEIKKVPVNAPEFQSNGPHPKLKGVFLSLQKLFFASQQAGTGASQNVAHGLGAVPAGVICIPTDGGTVTYGTHTETNVVVTVTNAKHFDVLAWL